MSRMSWEHLQGLIDDGTPAATLRTIAGKHGLDLPHTAALEKVGETRWRVYCQACTLHDGQLVAPCQRAVTWPYPAELVDIAGVAAGINSAIGMLGPDRRARHQAEVASRSSRD